MCYSCLWQLSSFHILIQVLLDDHQLLILSIKVVCLSEEVTCPNSSVSLGAPVRLAKQEVQFTNSGSFIVMQRTHCQSPCISLLAV